MSKFLIINADDFGYNVQQNEAIKELLQANLISSVSVMTVAPEADDAMRWLADNSISAGVHLTINSDSDENPWKSITGDKTLGANGSLFHKSSDITFHGRHTAVRSELEAQYKVMLSYGIEVDYADNHCGTLYGINLRRFYNDAYDFCREHNLPYRFPKKIDFIERQIGRKAPKALRIIHAKLVEKGLNQNVKLIDDLVSNPWNIQKIGDYETLRQWYLDAVCNCCDGVTEMFLHPALPAGEGVSEWTKRVFEYELLKSGDLLEHAKKNDVQIITRKEFRDM